MNDINARINIPQDPHIIGHKPSPTVNDDLKADVVSISGQKDDVDLKKMPIKELSKSSSDNNAEMSPLATEPNVPHIEMQEFSPTWRAVLPTLFYKGSDGDDKIHVSQDKDRAFIVNYNGHEKSFAREEFFKVSFDLGEGNNFFFADSSVKDLIYVKAGDGDNTIITGKGRDFVTAGDGNNTIRTGKGDDTVTVGSGNNKIYGESGNDIIVTGEKDAANIAPGVQNNGNNIIYGGSGDDVIVTKGSGNNKIYGNTGNDYLQGGLGNDTINGGAGNDIIYGLDGNDIISGGNGKNYIDGGNGDDIIRKSAEGYIISGGKGHDKINRSEEAVVLIDDSEIKNANGDKVHIYNSSKTANLGSSVKIEGDAEFKTRVESDLETMKALPSGIKMLEELDKTGKTITIKALNWGEKNGYAKEVDESKSYYLPNGETNTGSDVIISYNPSHRHANIKKSTDELPPLGVLFHEMAHAYNMATGTMLVACWADSVTGNDRARALEYQAVGLEIKNLIGTRDGIDHVLFQQDSTPVTSPMIHPDGTVSYNNPKGISENDLRADLNLAPRIEY